MVLVGIGIAVIVIAVSAIALMSVESKDDEKMQLEDSLGQPEIQSQQKEPFPVIPMSAECSGTAGCITGIVTSVMLGDTVEVDGQPVRLALADAPKIKYDGGKSGDFIEEICPVGSAVVVDQDDLQLEDKYGRMLGVVYCNGLNLNEELLDSGLGDLYSAFCNQSEFSTHVWAQKHGCTSSED